MEEFEKVCRKLPRDAVLNSTVLNNIWQYNRSFTNTNMKLSDLKEICKLIF